MEWQPIETAPKNPDGNIIGRMGSVVCTMAWDSEDEVWYTFNNMWEAHCERFIKHEYAQKGWQPTHWKPLEPLPQPPEKR